MTRCLFFLSSAATALAISLSAHGEQLARIATHSQRYGGQIEISAYDNPLLKGVTCYVSRSHDENALGGNSQPIRAPDA
jgi:CreA protein